jgi:hydroxyacylglutathione hydrolase
MTDTFEVFHLALGPLGANCFIVCGDGSALVIDPGDEADTVRAALDEIGATATAVLVTHGHFDHFGAVEQVAAATGAAVYVGAADAAQMADPGLGPLAGFPVDAVTVATNVLEGETELDLFVPVTAIPTPGHSRGSYTFAIAGHLFAGDLIFQGSVGRTDLPGGSMDQLLNSIGALVRRFPPDTAVHCGHGPDTSLGRELALNPFFAPLRHDPEHRW